MFHSLTVLTQAHLMTFISKYSYSLLTCHVSYHWVNKAIVPPKSPQLLMTFDLLPLTALTANDQHWRDLTLAPIWFPHWPIWRCTISRILCSSDLLVAITPRRFSSRSHQNKPLSAALSATPSAVRPKGPFYTRGTVTQPARGVASSPGAKKWAILIY